MSPSGFTEGCRAPTITIATAQTCRAIFVLPKVEAAMVKPSAEAMFLRPSTVNSRPMMMTTIHAGTKALPSTPCISTRAMNAAEISSLSAMGSSKMPRVVTCSRRRAKYPSAQSVAAASNRINTPQTSKCMVRPNISTVGLRVRRITISNGTKNIRSSVNEFGRFMPKLTARRRPVPQPPESHYRLRQKRRQPVRRYARRYEKHKQASRIPSVEAACDTRW